MMHAPKEIVVLGHGVFDLLHLGHIRHLKEARSLGDKLVVSITADHHVNKGPGRPQFSAEQRREALLALECVDEVIISQSGTAIESIQALKPAYYVKGPDYADGQFHLGLAEEIAAIEGVGGKFHTTTAEKWSSTALLRHVRLPPASLAYLEQARQRGFLDRIRTAFAEADKLTIAFIGETIIDEYIYVKPLGRPLKEPIPCTVYEKAESFQGGVMAASQHAEWKHARHLTSLDELDVITKTRFVDDVTFRKLYENYSCRDVRFSPHGRKVMRQRIRSLVKWADVCIVYDFGHGLMEEEEIDLFGWTGKSKPTFIAATAQANAANFGYNLISKYYTYANMVCVDEPEARLSAGLRTEPLRPVLDEMAGFATHAVITRGRNGSSIPGTDIPAFVDGGLDSMGAGDAFLAVAAPLVATGLPLEMAAFAGNVAGGLKTSIIGHRTHVTRDDIIKNIEWLLG